MATTTEDLVFFMHGVHYLIVSIMQPTFLPWIGYFNLIKQSQVFVFLDNVQFEPRSWQQRNRILVNNEPVWITVPVTKPRGSSTQIDEVLINYDHFDPAKVGTTLRRAYAKRSGIDWLEAVIIPLLNSAGPRLIDLNRSLILAITKSLDLKVNFVNASSLKTRGNKSEFLESILLNFEDCEYLSPKGAQVYLSELNGRFPSGIPIQFQEFKHPKYKQCAPEFIPFMSIIDAVGNIGVNETKELVK